MDKLPKFPIYVNAFEVGVLTVMISQSSRKDHLKEVFKQLMELARKFREEAGAKVEYIGKGRVKITDKSGAVIIREMYEWEKTGESETS